MHKPIDKAPIDTLGRPMKAVGTRIGNGHTPSPVLQSALKGGKLVYGRGAGKKFRFRCCPRVYFVESWKGDLCRETWKDPYDDDTDITPRSEDEHDYHGIAWLDQSQDPG